MLARSPAPEDTVAPGAYTCGGINRPWKIVVSDCFQLLSTIATESVDCIWTDPPYFLSNGGVTCRGGRAALVDKGDWDRSRGLAADYSFHARWIAEAFRVLSPAGTIWVSGTMHAHPLIGMALLRTGFRILNDIVWEKPCPPPNLGRRCFTHSTELIYWATKAPKGSAHRYTFDYEAMCLENGGRQMRTVWRLDPAPSEEKALGKHPAQKPVRLISRCLRASTRKGDLVLDPFAGSGSTAIAAVRLGRAFIGGDKEAVYVNLAIRRLKREIGDNLVQPLAL